MSCCAAISTDTGKLFSWVAGLNRLRFRLFGLETTQRQLVEGIRSQGLDGAELLEVGCGTGYLHQELLRLGAVRAMGVDLSERMLDIARTQAEGAGLGGRTEYRRGEFTGMAEDLPAADVVILDKVVCCYPDWEALVERSLDKTRRLYALTYPRNRGLTRVGVRVMTRALGAVGCCYRPFIHDPIRIQTLIRESRFKRAAVATTAAWLTEVYVREGPGKPRPLRPGRVAAQQAL
jgi:magnesium-protoporphyrin O-methyltransferase